MNRESWNGCVDTHFQSDFYDVKGFLAGNSSLMDIELGLLGDLKGKKVLHLQCHFGQDTISIARMGAAATGVDLSDKAIERARELAQEDGTEANFICCNIYDLPNHLNEQFDVVFTSYGVIGWLPDLDQWAKIISHFLMPGGEFVFVEFHPVIWMFDNTFEQIQYSYFNIEPIVETMEGTYADREAPLNSTSVSWNHSLGEVFGSLIQNGLEILSFVEYDYSPYNCFTSAVEVAPKKYRIKHLDRKIPMTYAIKAKRKEGVQKVQ